MKLIFLTQSSLWLCQGCCPHLCTWMLQVNGDELDRVLMTLSVEELQKVSGSMDELIQSSSTAIVKMLEHKEALCAERDALHKDIELSIVAVAQARAPQS